MILGVAEPLQHCAKKFSVNDFRHHLLSGGKKALGRHSVSSKSNVSQLFWKPEQLP